MSTCTEEPARVSHGNVRHRTRTYDVGQLHRWDEIVVYNRLKFGWIQRSRKVLIVEWTRAIDVENKIGTARNRFDRIQTIEGSSAMEFIRQRYLSDRWRCARRPRAGDIRDRRG